MLYVRIPMPMKSLMHTVAALFAIGIAGCNTDGGAPSGSSGSTLAACPAECDDGNPCTQDSCNQVAAQCTHVPLGGVAAPEDAQLPGDCKLGFCEAGVLSIVSDVDDPLDDANACTADVCEQGLTMHEPVDIGITCTEPNDQLAKVCDGFGGCVQCVGPADCTHLPEDDECQTRTCNNGMCGQGFSPAGTLVNETEQTAGDCSVVVCDGNGGNVAANDDSDVPDDQNDCTIDDCSNGAPSNSPTLANSPCGVDGVLYCDGSGSCVDCTADSQCGIDTFCRQHLCDQQTSVCGNVDTADNTSLPPTDQQSGDCQEKQCDGQGNVKSVALDGDLPPDDANDCTDEVCNAGSAQHPPEPLNTACEQGGGSFCDGNEVCVECNVATQCGSDTFCTTMVCDAKECVADFTDAATALPAGDQIDNDCKEEQCDGNGNVVSAPNDVDTPSDDGNQCTDETCDNGTPKHPAKAVNAACDEGGGSYCNGAGLCVECNTAEQCPTGTACESPTCGAATCSVTNNWQPDWNDCTVETCDPQTGIVTSAPQGDCWQPIAATGAPDGRAHHSAVWTGTRMIVFGGATDDGFTNTGGVYDPGTNSWEDTFEATAPFASRHAVAWFDGKMVVAGGNDKFGNRLKGAHIYDHANLEWTVMQGAGAEPYGILGTLAEVDGFLVFYGGDGCGGAGFPDGWVFSDTTPGITGFQIANAPGCRTGHTAVSTGTEMLVYGGHIGSFLADVGHAYDPVADEWAPFPGEPQPTYPYRTEGVAVWTGTRMLVWGGKMQDGPSGAANDWISDGGAAFDPSTNTWTPMTDTDAPLPRFATTAVWSGGEMIVWGGDASGNDPLGDGAKYDPASDTWSAISLTGAPPKRFSHTAVWTGEAMIVFGGSSNGNWLQDGAIYYP